MRCGSRQGFIKAALRSALNGLLISILDDSSCVKEFFEDTTNQVATTQKSLTITALAVTRDTIAIAPIVHYAAKAVKQKVKESVNDLVHTLLSRPPSRFDSPSDKSRKSRRNKAPKKKNSRRKLSLEPPELSTWSLKRSLTSNVKSSRNLDISLEVRNQAPEMKTLHVTNSIFRNVLKYKSYWLVNVPHLHKSIMAVRTGKYSKRIQTLMKAYKKGNKDPITVHVTLPGTARTSMGFK